MVVKSMSSFGNTVLTIRLVDGKFPDYKKVIPDGDCISFVANKKALISSLNRVRVVAKEDQNYSMLLTGDGNKLVLQSQNDTGRASDEIDFGGNAPEPFCFRINANYFLDAVKTISAEDVSISYKTDQAISVNGDGSSLNIVAVLRN